MTQTRLADAMGSGSAAQMRTSAQAFDAHAAHYDAVVEPNALLQAMRAELWAQVARCTAPPARLLDLGCGTGIDAAHFASRGYRVTAVDASAGMVAQTRERLERLGIASETRVLPIAAQDLAQLAGEPFDAVYSDLGPLNCVPDLRRVSEQCARLLRPHGSLIVSVMARVCPWEIAFFALKGDLGQARRRWSRSFVPVNLEQGTVWTRYYAPREFYAFFASEFELVSYRALYLFLPPPYLIHRYRRLGAVGGALGALDAGLDALPLFRDAGDHFLMTLRKRGRA